MAKPRISQREAVRLRKRVLDLERRLHEARVDREYNEETHAFPRWFSLEGFPQMLEEGITAQAMGFRVEAKFNKDDKSMRLYGFRYRGAA